MTRANYYDDIDAGVLVCWRGAVAQAIKGKRGQALLRDLALAMDAMPVKRLIAHKLVNDQGEVCALGALGIQRKLPLHQIDPEEYGDIAETFGVAQALVREIEYENDEGAFNPETPEQRWERMRRWVGEQLVVRKG